MSLANLITPLTGFLHTLNEYLPLILILSTGMGTGIFMFLRYVYKERVKKSEREFPDVKRRFVSKARQVCNHVRTRGDQITFQRIRGIVSDFENDDNGFDDLDQCYLNIAGILRQTDHEDLEHLLLAFRQE
jgi:hypothetical protein